MPEPDGMHPLPFGELVAWILAEYEARQTIFGIHETLFYRPEPEDPYALQLHGHRLATPIGPAAGPHTQLAQNIACAWLCGGRFIELKTVQVLDELEIPRPCIDAADEGYNVEWSQELRLAQSAREYVKAWALIHVLRRVLRLEEGMSLGTVFNASVGYDLEGIRSPPMGSFLDTLRDASAELTPLSKVLEQRYPQFADLEISPRISDNVTLSTMHGCPPDEIERIARYLLCERGLHTTVKLNPTLLGKARVREILHDRLGYHEIEVPETAFDHDLKYDRAVELIRSLQHAAAARGLGFGVKLSNTLPVQNHRDVLPGDEMYLSGRALYPLTVSLFEQLAGDVDDVQISYSAGADALNVAELLACGACPVTVATDLLKPGGYGRLAQYLEQLGDEMRECGASDLGMLARDAPAQLTEAVRHALEGRRYKKDYHPHGPAKVASVLGLFDCITAPCVEQCPVCQDVPDYAWWIEQGRYGSALDAILARNPLPGVTGYVCPQTCRTRCTRNDYDEPVAIRDLKRYAAQHGESRRRRPAVHAPTGHRVAVIGSGPSGLAASYFLALSGVETTVFEARDRPGGVLALAPGFRLPRSVVEEDIARIAALGVRFELGHHVQAPPEDLLREGYEAVYLACGAGIDATPGIPDIEGQGVLGALAFLKQVAGGEAPHVGPRVVVIGGGNTAVDAARTAQRLVARPVRVLYRRTRAEMPAEQDEVAALLAEGNELIELLSPICIERHEGRVAAIRCVRNQLGPPGMDGRRMPSPVAGDETVIDADTVIVAIGQRPALSLLAGSALTLDADGRVRVDPLTGETSVSSVYAGGDLTRGPATIVEACADGRRAAEAICRGLGVRFTEPGFEMALLSEADVVRLRRRRVQKAMLQQPGSLPLTARDGSAVVEQTFDAEAAQREACRCLQCRTVCDRCVDVCPNRANYSYRISPVAWQLPRLRCRDGKVEVCGHEAFVVEQSRQIVHVHDLCNECGNCATFCVHQGRPYEDKPRFALTEERFQRMQGDAWYGQGDCLWRRIDGRPHSLVAVGSSWLYRNGQVEAQLSGEFALCGAAAKEAFSATVSLRIAAEMAVVMEGLRASLPWVIRQEGSASVQAGAATHVGRGSAL